MERSEVRLQIPVTRIRLKGMKLLAAQRDTSVAELVRDAIETQYGDVLRPIERRARRIVPAMTAGTDE